MRGEVLTLRERDYVLAARALGATQGRLMLSHILPNVLPIVIVTTDHHRGQPDPDRIRPELSGRGGAAADAVWGNMLTDSRSYFVTGVHLVVWPGFLIMVTVLCFYLVGDGLRDALDPRLGHHEPLE